MYTQGFDGSTASGIALGAALKKQRAAAQYAGGFPDEIVPPLTAAMWGYPPGYHRAPKERPEPQLTFKPETPAEERIHTTAKKRGWGNRPAPAGEVHFIRNGAKDVVVTRDALKRVPALPDVIVRQLENG